MNRIQTGFIANIGKRERIYIIEDSSGNYLADVTRIYKIRDNSTAIYHQIFFEIEYELELNSMRTFSKNELQMIRIYYNNLVSTLTHDIQTFYTDNIDERMKLPFYQNILHVKIVS